jgi:hypothetical protein
MVARQTPLTSGIVQQPADDERLIRFLSADAGPSDPKSPEWSHCEGNDDH